MIYQQPHSLSESSNKTISPETSIKNTSKSINHNDVYNSRSTIVFQNSFKQTDNKNVKENNKGSPPNYFYKKSDYFDCIDIFDFEQDQEQMNMEYNNSDQGSSNDCYFSDEFESDLENNQNYIKNVHRYFDSNVGDDWGFEERTRPNEFADVGDIIGYAKLVKAQRDAAMGELDSLLSQIDSVFGIIKKGFNTKKTMNSMPRN
uniref:Uncharacterized protein n=1 Tax=Parastrongyloides trichosuri TaxID=131310 RepID=A0A0N4ZRZ1_PARTI